MSKFRGVYIASLDAKDIYMANNYMNDDSNIGYSLYNKNGNLNLNKFINSLDYSLELIKLREIWEKRNKRKKFSNIINGKEYSTRVINVTFNYSNKDWNRYGKNLYVKFGYNIRKLQLTDCSCIIDGELVAIQTDTDIANINDILSDNILGKYFYYDIQHNQYKQHKNFKTLNTVSRLREHLYLNGFICDGVKYCRYKRSSGSSRVGKCLFIDESLYSDIHEWEICGLDIEENQNIDLAAFESYISLTLSSIIDVIEIKKENILIIEDYEDKFFDDVIVTKTEGNNLITCYDNIEIVNSLWDGQSLLDVSYFKNYSSYGMLLLRNRFFKSACFNCNIQQWFHDNNITSISQLNGFTLASNISDVKLITTPNSIKYLKFVDGSYVKWFDNLSEVFGVVKHEKPTYYFNGRLVQMHYQLLNSLEMSYDEVGELVAPDLEFTNLLNSDIDVFKYYLKYPNNDDGDYSLDGEIKTQNDIIFKMIGLNNKFYHTKLCREFIKTLIKSYRQNLRCGHLTISGSYNTLFGNPIEMLKHTIGSFDGKTSFESGTVYTKFYLDGEKIVGSRSPHLGFSNVLLRKNYCYKYIDKYFNLSKEIICVNSIGDNMLNQLSGADI